jgi:predicted glutamine amidotransferase
MCIIAVKKGGQKMFPEETLRMMFANNPDGAGIMWYDRSRRKVGYRKGFMKVENLIEFINGRDWTNEPVVLHFRIGTSGHKTKLCTHPYPVYDRNHVSGFTDLAVCHNGVLSNYFPGYNSAINDSLNFTQKVLSKLDPSFIHDSDKLMLIEELIGTSKLAFIDNTGDITLLGNFIEDDGYIYSNQSYKPKEKPKYSLNSNRGYYSSSLFGQLEETDEEMDEKSLKRLDDYFSLTDLDGFQGEMGDFVY